MSANPVPIWHRAYLPPREAAQVMGIGEDRLRRYVNSADPPPMLRSGNGGKSLLDMAGLRAYLRERQNYHIGEVGR